MFATGQSTRNNLQMCSIYDIYDVTVYIAYLQIYCTVKDYRSNLFSCVIADCISTGVITLFYIMYLSQIGYVIRFWVHLAFF